MKYIHAYIYIYVLKCFLDTYSQMKFLTSELAVHFVSLEHQQHDWLQETSCAVW